MASRRDFPQDHQSAGLTAALRARKARKGPPDPVHDQPPPRPLPGPKRKPLRGQLDFDGNEAA